MTVFSEKVQPTFTSSDLNIIVVENFKEIFFDVFELEINGKKYVAEKVSEKDGKPIVSIPVNLNNTKSNESFLIEKGKEQQIFFNKDKRNKASFITEENNVEFDINDLVDKTIKRKASPPVVVNIQEAVDNIKEVKRQTKIYLENLHREYIERKKKEIDDYQISKKREINKISKKIKSDLVSEFYSIVNHTKEQITNANQAERDSIIKFINESTNNYVDEFISNIQSNNESAFKDLQKRLDSIANNVLSTEVSRIVEERAREVEKILFAKQKLSQEELLSPLTGKVQEIDKKLSANVRELSQSIKNFSEDYNATITTLNESNIEINDVINKGLNRALSRIGNVKTALSMDISRIEDNLRESVANQKEYIETYFSEKIKIINEKFDDLNQEYRKELINLIKESEDKLLQEIASIDRTLPSVIIKEARSKNKDNVEVSLEDIRKELESNISNKFSKEIVGLKRLIEMTSGGGGAGSPGSLAFNEETALLSISNGNTISLSSLSVSSSNIESDPIFTTWAQTNSAAYDATYTTVQANSAGWGAGGSDVSSLTANWESTYTTVQANSSDWSSQTLSYNENNYELSISSGNTISLSSLNTPAVSSDFLTFSGVVFVSLNGNDSNSGLTINDPKKSISAAIDTASTLITNGASGVEVNILDGEVYEVGEMSVPDRVSIIGDSATAIGSIYIGSEGSVRLRAHYSAPGLNSMLTLPNTGRSFYEVDILDQRGIDGSLTNVTSIVPQTGGVAFIRINTAHFVCASGAAIGSGSMSGHIHYHAADLYLAGESAHGITDSDIYPAGINIVGYIDHILNINGATNTVAIQATNPDTSIKIITNEIIANTVYNVASGSLWLISSHISGDRIGTPILEISDQIDSYRGTDIKSLTANWENTYTTVATNSASWDYQGSDVKSLTANWENTYTTVATNSASWGTGGGGSEYGWKLLGSDSGSKAALIVDNVVTADYDEYRIAFSRVAPVTDDVDLELVLRSSTPADIGGSYKSGNYYIGIDVSASSAASGNRTGVSGWPLTIVQGNLAGEFAEGSAYIDLSTNSAEKRMTYSLTYGPYTGVWRSLFGGGRNTDTTAVAGFSLKFSTGNVAGGEMKVYGLKNS